MTQWHDRWVQRHSRRGLHGAHRQGNRAAGRKGRDDHRHAPDDAPGAGGAALLEKEGVSAEVIDPRSLVPFDWELVKESVEKTGRVVTVEESPKRGGLGAEMIDSLVAPVKRVAAPNTPAPFYVPDAKRVALAAAELMKIS